MKAKISDIIKILPWHIIYLGNLLIQDSNVFEWCLLGASLIVSFTVFMVKKINVSIYCIALCFIYTMIVHGGLIRP